MTRMQVYLPDEIYRELRAASRINNKPMSEFVRLGLSKVLAIGKQKQADPFKFFVGKGRSDLKSDARVDFEDFYKNKPN